MQDLDGVPGRQAGLNQHWLLLTTFGPKDFTRLDFVPVHQLCFVSNPGFPWLNPRFSSSPNLISAKVWPSLGQTPHLHYNESCFAFHNHALILGGKLVKSLKLKGEKKKVATPKTTFFFFFNLQVIPKLFLWIFSKFCVCVCVFKG